MYLLWFWFYDSQVKTAVMYNNEFETKENKILAKDKIEPQHISSLGQTQAK